MAGDDDQGIYAWAGASARALLDFKGEIKVLSESHRLPRAVWAQAAIVASNIHDRHTKAFTPATDAAGVTREGLVAWLSRPEEVDLARESWFLLARTRRQLGRLAEIARDQGIVYTLSGRSSVDPEHVSDIREYETFRAGREDLPLWHDALSTIPAETREYYLACLRRDKRALNDAPRVRIDTVHGVKGLEADNVLLLTDLNARIRRGMELDADAENRVLYVAVTRARKALWLVEPQGSGRGYQL